MKRLLTLVLAFLFVSILSYSQDEIPKCKGFVSDYENIFTTKESKDIARILSDYEKKTSVEIYVLTISDFDDIFTLAQETFTEWGIGKKGVDNGLLIVISKNKKVMRTHTGYGLEGYLPDGWLKHTGDSIGIKYPDNYYNGLLEYISLITNKVGEEYDEDVNSDIIKENKSDEEESIFEWLLKTVPWYVWPLLIIGWLILFFICPDCALFLLFLIFSKDGDSGKSSSGGGSSGGGGSNSKW